MENPRALESQHLYTVGWISALSLELAAASAMLDEEHNKPLEFAPSPSDKNIYTFGRIGEHNVVLTSLSAGKYGTNSAATTVSQMLSSFPSIRVGLMVGIGAGVPLPEVADIRLGDVVVSQPDGRCGGVIQYDLRKAKSGGTFERRGMLSSPPETLLNALATLQARHERRGSNIPELLHQMLELNPHMRISRPSKPAYVYQGRENDRLFKADYIHSGGTTCKECDRAGEIEREKRESTDPEIHYGIIASGNTLVKDATERDSIVRGTGEQCICLEMEASGIMDAFPCLVIRGICDYADSHKNDRWQRYAAVTAAAYAKEFLGVVPYDDLKQTKKASEVLQEVLKTAEDTNTTVQEIHEINLSRELNRWLAPTDPSTNFNKAIKIRHKDTGVWFLQSSIFEHWKMNGTFLWLHGLAGCGKTILSSAIIDHLKDDTAPQRGILLYFFFDFNDTDKQSHDKLVRTLVAQLYKRNEQSRCHLDLLFKSCEAGSQQPKIAELEETFTAMLSKAGLVEVVLDALDESTQRAETIRWLGKFSTSGTHKLRVIVTSRNEHDIETAFAKWIPTENTVPIDRSDTNEDIRMFVRSQVQTDERLERWRTRPDVQEEIEIRLMEKADGMFRWAACQLDALQNCLDLPSLEHALDNLPVGLDETYSRILARVDPMNRTKAVTMLQLLVYSSQPLCLDELVDALAVQNNGDGLHFNARNRMPVPKDILTLVSGLATLEERKSFRFWEVTSDDNDASSSNEDDASLLQVRLAHFSVKEYLLSTSVIEPFRNHMAELTAKTAIVQICLTYLSDIDSLDNYNFKSILKLKQLFPFSTYAAEFWPEHAAMAQTDEYALLQIVQFLEHNHGGSSGFAKSVRLFHARSKHIFPLWWDDREPSPSLRYASAFALTNVVLRLLQRGANINENATDCKIKGVLAVAASIGHIDLVQMLLDHGAMLTEESLIWAAKKGHVHVAQLLLDHGVSTDVVLGKEEQFPFAKRTKFSRDSVSYALYEASRSGRADIVKILLEYGADVNYQRVLDDGSVEYSPLHSAAIFGHMSVVQLLLDNNANVKAVGPYGRTPLHCASWRNQTDIAEFLLLNNADVNAVDRLQLTPLHYAAARGSIDIVFLLLKHGANPYARDKEGKTALDMTPEDREDIRLVLLSAAEVATCEEETGARGPMKAQEATEKPVKRWYDPFRHPRSRSFFNFRPSHLA